MVHRTECALVISLAPNEPTTITAHASTTTRAEIRMDKRTHPPAQRIHRHSHAPALTMSTARIHVIACMYPRGYMGRSTWTPARIHHHDRRDPHARVHVSTMNPAVVRVDTTNGSTRSARVSAATGRPVDPRARTHQWVGAAVREKGACIAQRKHVPNRAVTKNRHRPSFSLLKIARSTRLTR